MARNRRQQVVIGFEGAIKGKRLSFSKLNRNSHFWILEFFINAVKVFNLDPEKESEHHLNITNPYVRNHHTDIVTCIQFRASRFLQVSFLSFEIFRSLE